MTDLAPTELGQLLEKARKLADGTGISGREAARRAGISESRWRQVLRDGRAPAPTVVAAALGVQADPAQALQAAGLPTDPDTVQALTEEAQRPKAPPAELVTGLAEEIDRIRRLPLPPDEKIRVAQGMIALFEERARENAE